MKNMSAKDAAFEKERCKFRSQIRKLESEKEKLEIQTRQLQYSLQEKDSKIEELNDWIRRLLEYTEMSQEDLQCVIKNEKEKREFAESFGKMERILTDNVSSPSGFTSILSLFEGGYR